MATSAGLEPAALSLEGLCSIHLSYEVLTLCLSRVSSGGNGLNRTTDANWNGFTVRCKLPTLATFPN